MEKRQDIFDVFISYSHADKTVADGICANLEANGIRCWYAPRDIRPGDDWADAIMRAIGEASCFVLIFSGKSNQSGQVKNEVTAAFNAGCMIIPFKLEDVPMQGALSYYLTPVHWIDAVDAPLLERITLLYEHISDYLKKGRKPFRPVPIEEPVSPVEPDPGNLGDEPLNPPLRRRPARKIPKVFAVVLILLIGWGILAMNNGGSKDDTAAITDETEETADTTETAGDQETDTADTTETAGDQETDTDEATETADEQESDTADTTETSGTTQTADTTETTDSGVLIADSSFSNVLGNEACARDSIQSITFLDSTQDTSAQTIADLWDASEAQDESVWAFTIENDDGLYDLYICADGGVTAPENCRRLFAFYASLESINFNDSFDMSGTTNMREMFRSCTLLTELDLDGLDTGNVTNMSTLFAYATSLTELNLNCLDTSNVTDMSYMFYSTSAELAEYLAANVFENFNTASVVRFHDFMGGTSYDWAWLFEDCEEANEAEAVWIAGTDGANANEESANLFDQDTSTKWCVTSFSSKDVYVIWEMSEAISADGMLIATANDTEKYPGRNPCSWSLYAANGDAAPDADSDEWTLIEQVEQRNSLPTTSESYFRYTFQEVADAYQYYMLVITEVADGDTMQISEVELLY